MEKVQKGGECYPIKYITYRGYRPNLIRKQDTYNGTSYHKKWEQQVRGKDNKGERGAV